MLLIINNCMKKVIFLVILLCAPVVFADSIIVDIPPEEQCEEEYVYEDGQCILINDIRMNHSEAFLMPVGQVEAKPSKITQMLPPNIAQDKVMLANFTPLELQKMPINQNVTVSADIKIEAMELKIINGKEVSITKGTRPAKLFGLISIEVPEEKIRDAGTNQVVSVNYPWWSFLVRW